MAIPMQQQPFVLPTRTVAVQRQGAVDLYLPAGDGQRPVVLFVPGGPVPAEFEPRPRDWPVYHGYGGQAAARGVVGAVVDHRLHSLDDYDRAGADVVAAVDLVRAHERVDADRVALWFFSGGGLLCGSWLAKPPEWLRCIGLTYPIIDSLPDRKVDLAVRPIDALADAGDLPIVLTRVGRERAEAASAVAEFVDTAQTNGNALEVVDVQRGEHGFDTLTRSDEACEAVESALGAVLGHLGTH
ncbi:MAG: alpha/beta hydrolase [Nocardioidaceae bacterium]